MWRKWHIPINRKLREESGAQIIQWVGMAVFLVIFLGGVAVLSQNRGEDIGGSTAETIDSWVKCLGENNCKDGKDVGETVHDIVIPKPKEKKCKWWDLICHAKKAVNAVGNFFKKAFSAIGNFFKEAFKFIGKVFAELGRQLWGFIRGFFLQLWDALKGLALLAWDLVRLPFVKSVQDKYLNLLKHFLKDPFGTIVAFGKAFVEPFVEAFKNGEWGEAFGRIAFEVASIFVPGDEVGKLGKLGKIADNLPGGGKPKPGKPDVPDAPPAKPGAPDGPDAPPAKPDPGGKPDNPTTKPPEPDAPDGPNTKPLEKDTPDPKGPIDPKAAKEFDDIAAEFGLTPSELADAILDNKVLCKNSFSADTLVSTAYGLRPISRLTVGTRVLAYNQFTETEGYYDVTELHVHHDPVVVVVVIDGETIVTTPEHPFFANNRWIDAAELAVGDSVRRAGGDLGRVQSTETIPTPQTMYNLTVDTAHTYFVGEGQWLVHNQGGGRCLRASALSGRITKQATRRSPRTNTLMAPNVTRGGDGLIVFKSGKRPSNSSFAGKRFELQDPVLKKKYPHGVKFDHEGFPDFSPYVHTTNGRKAAVEIKMKGNRTSDFTAANKAAGFQSTPKGFTWHHHQDRKTMILIPTDLHDAVRHTGGVAMINSFGALP